MRFVQSLKLSLAVSMFEGKQLKMSNSDGRILLLHIATFHTDEQAVIKQVEYLSK